MRPTLFSPWWYRVADLHPRLAGHLDCQQQTHGDDIWWVIHDPMAQRQHRLTASAWQLVAMMDGHRSVQEIWSVALDGLGEDAPTQQETIQLLAQLHASALIQCETPPDVEELFQRQRSRRNRGLRQRFMNPLFMRLPLTDPDTWLRPLARLLAPLFRPWFVVAWTALVILALVLVAANWGQLAHMASHDLLAPWNMALMVCVFPVLKLLHELGHAVAVRRWGGEVHEMGIMLLVLLPVPYVDASAASVFPDRRRRLVVGAAGMVVELLLAALATFLWLATEPGFVHLLAFDVMVIGGVGSVLFNGNPLLKFDAYYMLCDLVGLPNLATRSREHLAHLGRRALFGQQEPPAEATARERRWFVGYGIAACCCRLVILLSIAIYLAGSFMVVGVVLAIWALLSQVLLPIGRAVRAVLTAPQLPRARGRAMATSGAVLGLMGLGLFAMPVPALTVAQGVVWLADDALVRTGGDCFVRSLEAEPGSQVVPGTLIARCDDPVLAAQITGLRAGIRSLQHEYNGYALRDQVRRSLLAEDIAGQRAELDRLLEQSRALEVRAQRAGTLMVPQAENLPGRFLRQGAVVAMVLEDSAATIRVVLAQEQRGRVLANTRAVSVRVLGSSTAEPSRITRQVPSATQRLPSAALGDMGGGAIPVDVEDPSGLRTLADVFQLDLALPPGQRGTQVGRRVLVRFDHGSETLAKFLARSTRLLFLRQFDV